jgi:hypothetical protein
MQILFNNVTEYTYDFELLIVIKSLDSANDKKVQH